MLTKFHFTTFIGAVFLSLMVSGLALADPPADPNPNAPKVFCFRITDMERGPGADSFRIEFEVLNWTNNSQAVGLNMAMNVGTSPGVTISGASIDPDGRGGPVGGSDIGAGVSDPIAIHSGRGRGDIPNQENDWVVKDQTDTSVTWDAQLDADKVPLGTELRNRNLLFAIDPLSLVPGLGIDALGDSAIDGGPGPYDDQGNLPGGGPPIDEIGNVLDGFVLDVDGFEVGDTLSLNWFLFKTDFEGSIDPIGTSGFGNNFGFGTFSLARIPLGGPLPGALFEGNTGFTQAPICFSIVSTTFRILPSSVASWERALPRRSAKPPTTCLKHRPTRIWLRFRNPRPFGSSLPRSFSIRQSADG